jgi:hypothetical protein
MKKLLQIVALVGVAWVLSGCKSTFTNFTPELIPVNPSGIYTFSFSARVPMSSIVPGTEQAHIVINGERYPMQRMAGDGMRFTYDYKMPAGLAEARYYYELSYAFSAKNNVNTTRTHYSTHDTGRVFQSRLIEQYTIKRVNSRGPAGSRIAIVGNGFTPQDVVVINGVEAATEVFSGNSLQFAVPPLPASRSYEVFLRTGSGDLLAGQFMVDPATLRVQPAALDLASGSADLIVFEISAPAPAGGIPVQIETDIPHSIIMAEVVIPAGSRTVTARVEGGAPGTGLLVARIPGFNTVEISVSVHE